MLSFEKYTYIVALTRTVEYSKRLMRILLSYISLQPKLC